MTTIKIMRHESIELKETASLQRKKKSDRAQREGKPLLPIFVDGNREIITYIFFCLRCESESLNPVAARLSLGAA